MTIGKVKIYKDLRSLKLASTYIFFKKSENSVKAILTTVNSKMINMMM